MFYFCYEVSTIVESVLFICISWFLSFEGVYAYVFPYLLYSGFSFILEKLGFVVIFLGYFSLSSSFFYSTSSILSLSTYPLKEYLAVLKFGSIQTSITLRKRVSKFYPVFADISE